MGGEAPAYDVLDELARLWRPPQLDLSLFRRPAPVAFVQPSWPDDGDDQADDPDCE